MKNFGSHERYYPTSKYLGIFIRCKLILLLVNPLLKCDVKKGLKFKKKMPLMIFFLNIKIATQPFKSHSQYYYLIFLLFSVKIFPRIPSPPTSTTCVSIKKILHFFKFTAFLFFHFWFLFFLFNLVPLNSSFIYSTICSVFLSFNCILQYHEFK